jgi:hypothetical protein
MIYWKIQSGQVILNTCQKLRFIRSLRKKTRQKVKKKLLRNRHIRVKTGPNRHFVIHSCVKIRMTTRVLSPNGQVVVEIREPLETKNLQPFWGFSEKLAVRNFEKWGKNGVKMGWKWSYVLPHNFWRRMNYEKKKIGPKSPWAEEWEYSLPSVPLPSVLKLFCLKNNFAKTSK